MIRTVLVLPSPPALLPPRSRVDPVAALRQACATAVSTLPADDVHRLLGRILGFPAYTVAAVNGFFSGRGQTWTVLGIEAFGTAINVVGLPREAGLRRSFLRIDSVDERDRTASNARLVPVRCDRALELGQLLESLTLHRLMDVIGVLRGACPFLR